MRFFNIRIPTRIIGGYGMLLAICVGLALIAVLALDNIGNRVAMNEDTNQISKSLVDARREEKNFMLNPTDRYIGMLAERLAKVTDQAERLKPKFSQRHDREMMDEIITSARSYEDKFRAYAAAYMAISAAEGGRTQAKGGPLRAVEQAMVDAARMVEEAVQKANSEQKAAMQDSIRSGRNGLLITLAAGMVLGIAVGTVTARSITRPLARLMEAVGTLSSGNTDVTVRDTDRADEIGPLAKALEGWRQSLLGADSQRRKDQEAAAAQEERQRRIDAATQKFDATITAMLAKIKATIEQLHRSADTLSTSAKRTERQGAAVSAASEQATANVETVSAAASQLRASVGEISQQVQLTAATTQAAAAQAEDSNRKIAGLAEAAQKIGEIVSLINGIASQTNLLALNATIESARAGEAGKGFAVVAHEVKNLAGQTGRATDDIATQVASIQRETEDAVRAIAQISETVDRINQMATTIAGSVEEQGAATAQITRNVEQVSAGTRDVASNIADVADVAAQTGSLAQDVFRSADNLRAESETLAREVNQFLRDVRAA